MPLRTFVHGIGRLISLMYQLYGLTPEEIRIVEGGK